MSNPAISAPVDTVSDLTVVNTFGDLPPQFYTKLKPRGVSSPRLIHANQAAAELLGLDKRALESDAFLQIVAGLSPLPSGDPLAAVYSGHQFGVWAGQLGDGRAHLIGEVRHADQSWELQLKGAGMTPYSRMGDGRAVLRSSVREYLAAEAMAGLGIPTTRSLALVGSPDPVRRETMETAAIVTRMAPSFVRFGSFEHWAAKQDVDSLRILANYVVDQFYPECRVVTGGDTDLAQTLLRLLAEVSRRTAHLMAQWQAVGFCHGVMNTDNMSILGLTLDYGPFGFLDGFNANHVCNHSDAEGRYAWNRQPTVGLWNLYRLAGAFQPIVQDEAALRAVLDDYEHAFQGEFNRLMALKIGLSDLDGEERVKLVDDLFTLMHQYRADFTLSFRRLSDAVRGDVQPFCDLFIDRDAARSWFTRLHAAHQSDSSATSANARADAMDAVNPLYVLRNHLAEEAIRSAKAEDYAPIARLMTLLKNPFVRQNDAERYAQLPPDWASDLEVSCSS